ncbi:uncharacterized protein F5147DRAFT_656194 [Suillus discolor]|uniref:Uncharacterized protein n=1 Tax=Suillus discolor TaxID=1912936 RepID=A0A9P7EYI9_9AGAM|nr:uncharacterized protein F5147DRAFT_656194 [Suillus discolor]KAG2097952.1 hypothetical protein F5147DRAFT_656194 [Suillus discolor]
MSKNLKGTEHSVVVFDILEPQGKGQIYSNPWMNCTSMGESHDRWKDGRQLKMLEHMKCIRSGDIGFAQMSVLDMGFQPASKLDPRHAPDTMNSSSNTAVVCPVSTSVHFWQKMSMWSRGLWTWAFAEIQCMMFRLGHIPLNMGFQTDLASCHSLDIEPDDHSLDMGFETLQPDGHPLDMGFNTLQPDAHPLDLGFNELQLDGHPLDMGFDTDVYIGLQNLDYRTPADPCNPGFNELQTDEHHLDMGFKTLQLDNGPLDLGFNAIQLDEHPLDMGFGTLHPVYPDQSMHSKEDMPLDITIATPDRYMVFRIHHLPMVNRNPLDL